MSVCQYVCQFRSRDLNFQAILMKIDTYSLIFNSDFVDSLLDRGKSGEACRIATVLNGF